MTGDAHAAKLRKLYYTPNDTQRERKKGRVKAAHHPWNLNFLEKKKNLDRLSFKILDGPIGSHCGFKVIFRTLRELR